VIPVDVAAVCLRSGSLSGKQSKAVTGGVSFHYCCRVCNHSKAGNTASAAAACLGAGAPTCRQGAAGTGGVASHDCYSHSKGRSHCC